MSIDRMLHLIDFLPVDAAAWVERRVHRKATIRIDGPPQSGKTQLLAAFANIVGEHVSLGGLAETREEGLECLRHRPDSMMLVMPAFVVRGLLNRVEYIVLRQGVDVVIVDDPSAETWSVLDDLMMSGVRVWASTADSSRKLETTISIRLGTDPTNRVELITVGSRPVYWVENGKPTFHPEEP